MARNPTQVLLTVRLLAVQQAHHALTTCLAAEAAAAEALRVIDDTTQRDRVANQEIAESHSFLDMFARRLQATVADRHTAQADLKAAVGASAEARAALVGARTQAEAVETLIDERAGLLQADGRRREQHALDDMARTRFDSPFR